VEILIIILAYFVGSISFGIILSKYFKLQDPRNFGSKNPGATNVMRSGKKLPAFLTLMGDMLKATLMVSTAQYFNFSIFYTSLVGAVVFLGHLFPIYFSFKGGKGVASAFGVILSMDYIIALIVLITWVCSFLIWRISSLAALMASIALPFLSFFMVLNVEYFYLSLFLSFFLIVRHKENIKKLITRNESVF
jgi:glycerol-3-phosphate acyltransferase PlsY